MSANGWCASKAADGCPSTFQHRSLSRYRERDRIAPFTPRRARRYRPPSHRRRFPMLPANTLAAISNVVALNLEPQTTMAILSAILAPVLPDAGKPQPRAGRPRSKPRKAPQRKRKKARERMAAAPAGEPTDSQRQRAARALKANPGVSLIRVATIAGVSRSTVVNAGSELEAAARKEGRRASVPQGHARPWRQAGERRRGGGRQGARRSDIARTSSRRSRHRHQPRQHRQYALRAVELARLGHRL